MYSYITKTEVNDLKSNCMSFLTEMQEHLRREHKITMQIYLIGSGMRNLITKDENGIYDLDFNLEIMSGDTSDAHRLKELIRTTLDSKKDLYSLSYGRDSHVPITYTFRNNNSKTVNLDIGIVMLNKKTDKYSRIVRNGNNYIWNEVFDSSDLNKRVVEIKNRKRYTDLKNKYLELKNRYGHTKESFEIYSMAVNEVYQKGVRAMSKVSGNTHSKSEMNHHANQSNPNNSAHKAAKDNHANQLNPNNKAYTPKSK